MIKILIPLFPPSLPLPPLAPQRPQRTETLKRTWNPQWKQPLTVLVTRNSKIDLKVRRRRGGEEEEEEEEEEEKEEEKEEGEDPLPLSESPLSIGAVLDLRAAV